MSFRFNFGAIFGANAIHLEHDGFDPHFGLVLHFREGFVFVGFLRWEY